MILDLIKPPEHNRSVEADGAGARRVRGGTRHERPRSRRTHMSWLLFALGLVPWGALMVVPELWKGLPPGVQGAAYLISMMLVVAASSLILDPGDEPRSEETRDAAPARKMRIS
jgi:hypothetical protein